MTDRKREPLPAGYQFGDARRPAIAIRLIKQWDIVRDAWRWPEGNRRMLADPPHRLYAPIVSDPNDWNVD